MEGLALASVERSAIDAMWECLAGQGILNLEKMDQEHLDLTKEVALHSLGVESRS